ncbi:MAG: hypothetical protein Q8K60_08790 [Parachlamydiaceae bacterium]|nr:hypothetical protein [Parachlamydiaceae bacterium]
MFKVISIIFTLLAFTPIIAQNSESLDCFCYNQEWVLETKQIHIPGYPHAFNPSIVKWKNNYLLSFRIVADMKDKFTCRIGLVKLDENFNVINKPQLLDTVEVDTGIPPRIDDARLILNNDQLWMIYADNKKDIKVTAGGFRVYLGQLIEENGQFILLNQECLSKFEGEKKTVREKNWTPFIYNQEILLAYSLNPHRIFSPIIGLGECLTITETEGNIFWPWGTLRGGTPALLNGDHYLGFFHSSIDMESSFLSGKKHAHYFMGAYTFSSEPPFEIKMISPKPIIGQTFYQGNDYTPYWKPVTVVFPCGFIDDGQFIWISYGKHDHECWIVKLNKTGLMESLVPVI